MFRVSISVPSNMASLFHPDTSKVIVFSVSPKEAWLIQYFTALLIFSVLWFSTSETQTLGRFHSELGLEQDYYKQWTFAPRASLPFHSPH